MLKRIVKQSAGGFARYCGITGALRRGRMKDAVSILMYHSIGFPEHDISGMKVGIEDFRLQMAYLKENYHIISLYEFVTACGTEGEIPPYSVIITFDDGYRDNFQCAFPVLKEYGIPAVIFVTADLVGTNGLLWFDEVAQLVKRSSAQKLSLDVVPETSFQVSSEREKKTAVSRLIHILNGLREDVKRSALKELRIKLSTGRRENPEDQLMGWEEVRAMSGAGITIGSHGATHAILSRLKEADLEKEISGSKKTIEAQIGRSVDYFSYANGGPDDFNATVIEKLKGASYKAACTAIQGTVSKKDDLFSLKRKGIEADSSAGLNGRFSRSVFESEMSGLYRGIFFRDLR